MSAYIHGLERGTKIQHRDSSLQRDFNASGNIAVTEMPVCLDESVSLTAIAFITERFQIRQAITSVFRERNAVVDFQPNADTARTATNTSELISLHDEEPLSK